MSNSDQAPEGETKLPTVPEDPSASEVLLERFTKTFETSARRWELIVYPSLFAFIVLAGYGFFLVYSLSRDMHYLAKAMDPDMSAHLEAMTDSVSTLALNIALMTDRMNEMSINIESMDESTGDMNVSMDEMRATMVGISGKMDALQPMLVNISGMNQAIQAMTTHTGVMTQDMSQMNRNVSRPMSFMNSFFPW